MTVFHSEDIEIKIEKIIPEPISVFFQALNPDLYYYKGQKSQREFHCIECGLPVLEIVNRVLYMIDNPATALLEGKEMGFLEVRCKRCKQPYRFHI